MSSTGVSTDELDRRSRTSGSCDMKLEVVTLPVSDVDRAKRFYESLGWRCDADIVVGESFRAVQLTPPHSACSIAFGKGLTTGEPGSVKRLLLAVEDIDAAREDVSRCGVEVSEVFHLAGGRVPGPDPQGRSYQSYAVVQRSGWQRVAAAGDQDAASGSGVGGLTMDVASLADLLHETAEHHDPYEKTHAAHNWWDWYAAYMNAREHGSTPDEAAEAAGRYMEELTSGPSIVGTL